MNFWNNPENNPLKVLIVVVIVALAGYFIFHHMNAGNKGSVLSIPPATSTAVPAPTSTITVTTSITPLASSVAHGSSKPASQLCTETVCAGSGADHSKCVVLNGVSNDGTSCVLNNPQSTTQATALVNLLK